MVVICCAKEDALVRAEESLQRDVFADHNGCDRAVLSNWLCVHDGNVAIENAGVGHAVTANAQRKEVISGPDFAGYGNHGFDVFDCGDWVAGGDPTH